MTEDLAAQAEAAAKSLRKQHDDPQAWESALLESLVVKVRRLQAEAAAMRETLFRESLQCVIHHVGSELSVCETHKESVPCWVQRALASNAGADLLAEREQERKDFAQVKAAYETKLKYERDRHAETLREWSSPAQRERLETRLAAAEKVCEEAAVMTGLPSQMRQAIKAWRALKAEQEGA